MGLSVYAEGGFFAVPHTADLLLSMQPC